MRPTRNVLLAVTLAAAAITLPVMAQQSSDYPPPCEASKVTKADVDRAHTVYLSGRQFLDESNYDKAISYFKDAYSIDCSVHGILPAIATAYERKGDKAEAVRALEEYLRRAPNAPDHEVIERRIKNLKDQLARDQPAPTATAPAATATVSPPPPPPASATGPAEPPPAATASLTSPPPPGAEPASSEGHSVAPWIVVGIGGAALAAGIVIFAVGQSDLSSADKVCSNRSACKDANAVNQGNTGRTLVNVGGGVAGGGLAVAAAGLLWHFLEKPGGAAPSAAVPRVSPVAAPGYAGVSLSGAF